MSSDRSVDVLVAGGGMLSLCAARNCNLSLRVDELRSAHSRLASGGFTPAGEPARLSGGGVWQDCTVVYLRDPDDAILELIERAKGG